MNRSFMVFDVFGEESHRSRPFLWNGNIAREGTAANRAGHDSHFPQENICTAYDSGPHEDRSCRCQGAAQRNVFALWVFAYEAIAADLHRSLRSAFTLLPPCREEECIGC